LNDKRMSSIYVMNADGSKPRKLVDGAGAIWSPDGSRIAYTAQGEPNNTTQIFTRYMDAEGAVTQVTRLTSAPGSLRWSPDGKWLAFTTQVPNNTPTPRAEAQLAQFRPRGATWTAAPRVVGRSTTGRTARASPPTPCNTRSSSRLTAARRAR
jgi:Tol biopolymer transport system component